MKIFLVALSAIVGAAEEPSELQMRDAFSESLTLQIRNVLEFVGETEGTEAVARLRDVGHDRFTINTFQKRDCRPQERGYVCDFDVDIGLVNGRLQRAVTGRFVGGPDGLIFFVQEV